MVSGPVLTMNSSRLWNDFEEHQPMSHGSGTITSLLHEQVRRQKSSSSKSATDEDLDAASFYIPKLPGQDPSSTLKMFAGHIPSAPPSDPDSDSHLFFFLVRNRHIADKEKLVIWINGGPGCSSFDGALMEVGPFRLKASEKEGDVPTLKEVSGAWNEYSNVLFLDQPAGTGYSYVGTNHYVRELPVAADHVVEFLRRFYKVFPEFQKMDTYLAGESYAGQYIPYTADAILKSKQIQTPLQGLLIGNGWFDPWTQYPAYLPFAYQAEVLQKGSVAAKPAEKAQEACQKAMDRLGKGKVPVHEDTCEDILNTILDSTVQTVNGQKLCINTYDVRLTDKYPACGMNWPPDLTNLYQYLPRQDVKDAFHASKKEGGWVECSGQVGGHFRAKTSAPSVTLLPRLLEQIPILLFAGDQDLICNWLGISNMIDEMKWNDHTGFGSNQALDWFVGGKPAGTWQSARNLSFVKVADASHMVPFDVPTVSHDMLLRFQNTDFLSAAGAAAKIPSRIGSEQAVVIGHTHPNGTVYTTTPASAQEVSGKSASSAAVRKEDPQGIDNSAAAYYNAGSAVVVLLLLGVVAAIFFTLRKKVRQAQDKQGELGRYEAATFSEPSTPHSASGGEKSRRMAQHKRGLSVTSRSSSQAADDVHELERLVKRDGQANDGSAAVGHSTSLGASRTSVIPEEDVFSLGGDSDEGDPESKSKR